MAVEQLAGAQVMASRVAAALMEAQRVSAGREVEMVGRTESAQSAESVGATGEESSRCRTKDDT